MWCHIDCMLFSKKINGVIQIFQRCCAHWDPTASKLQLLVEKQQENERPFFRKCLFSMMNEDCCEPPRQPAALTTHHTGSDVMTPLTDFGTINQPSVTVTLHGENFSSATGEKKCQQHVRGLGWKYCISACTVHWIWQVVTWCSSHCCGRFAD